MQDRETLDAGNELISVAQKLGAPIVKALLGKAVVPDDSPYSIGGIGLLGTEPASDAMSEADTLFMIGTSFPYIDYLPRPGQAKGIQIDIKQEKVGMRYPVDIGLVGDSKLTLSALIPLLHQKTNLEFLKSKQEAMKNWNKLIKERSSRTDRPIKPQYVADILSEELEDNAIISVDSGDYHYLGCSSYQPTKRDEIFSFWNTSFNGVWLAVCNCCTDCIS